MLSPGLTTLAAQVASAGVFFPSTNERTAPIGSSLRGHLHPAHGEHVIQGVIGGALFQPDHTAREAQVRNVGLEPLTPGQRSFDTQNARARLSFPADQSCDDAHPSLVGGFLAPANSVRLPEEQAPGQPLAAATVTAMPTSVALRQLFAGQTENDTRTSRARLPAPARRRSTSHQVAPGHFFTPGQRCSDAQVLVARHFSAGHLYADIHLRAACTGAAR